MKIFCVMHGSWIYSKQVLKFATFEANVVCFALVIFTHKVIKSAVMKSVSLMQLHISCSNFGISINMVNDSGFLDNIKYFLDISDTKVPIIYFFDIRSSSRHKKSFFI